MSVTIYWNGDDSTVTSFDLKKSVDKGLTYSALATVTYDVNSAEYNKQRKQFFHLDGAGNPGDVYKLTATGSLGTSKPALIVAPPLEPDVCLVIGYLRDVFGFAESVAVHVTAYGTIGERWAKNPGGVVSHNNQALGIIGRTSVVQPDDSGMWQVELIRGVYARIEIPALGFVWTFEVPEQDGPVNIRDVPQLRGQALAMFPEMAGERNVLPES